MDQTKKRTARTPARALPLRVNPVTAAVATAVAGMTVLPAATAAPTEELIVSATRRDTSVQEVPYSISALGAEEIEAFRIEDLSAVARRVPGLVQVDQGARDANRLIIRGINSSPINSPELLNNSTGERVATYYGETPVYINLQPIDIERIEVLRGPQGTLYGARSLGGLVRYIPAKPDPDALTADLRVGGSTTAESSGLNQQAEAVVNVPLVEGSLALRALLGYEHERGYIDYKYLVPEPGVSCPEPGFADPECSSDGFEEAADANNIRTRSYGLSLLWTPFDELEATLRWRHQNRSIGARNINSSDALRLIEDNRGVNLDTGGYVSGLRFVEPNNRVNDIGNLEITWDTGFAELLSSTSYTTYESTGSRDQTDLLLDLDYYYDDFPAFAAFTNDRLDDEFFTQEVRLVSTDDGPLSWIAGAFYQDADLFSRSQEFTPGYAAWDPFFTTAEGDLEYDNKTFQNNREFALYGELGYDVTERLNLLVGFRWFDYESELRTCTAFPIATTGFGGSPDVDDPSNCEPMTGFENVDDDDILGKFTASYAVSDDLNAYFTFSEGYSTGGVNVRYDVASERLIEPERTENYEVGVKSRWLDERLVVNAALYYIDWTDIQVQGQTITNGLPITRNGSKAESRGLELDVSAQLTDRLELTANYAYTDAELAQGCTLAQAQDPAVNCVLPDAPTASGDRLPGTPEHQGNLLISYTQPLANELDARLDYGMTVQSDVLTRIGNGNDCCRDNGEALPGFALHYAAASLRGDAWEATLYADNLFDKYAVTGVRETRASLTTANGAPGFALRRYFQNVVRPRTIGLDLRLRF